MNKTAEIAFESALRDALREDTPPAADALIRKAIHASSMAALHDSESAMEHRHIGGAMLFRRWAAAAGIAIALGVGAWMYGHERKVHIAALREDGEIMLEIIGLASVDDVYSMDLANIDAAADSAWL